MLNTSRQPYYEVEITLIICSEEPKEIARQIAELTQVGSYRVESAGQRAISDVYLDTPERELHRADVSLRVRRIDGNPWITFKGPDQRSGWGEVSRLEVEYPWSEEALDLVLAQLEESGVGPPARQTGRLPNL